MAKHGHAKKGKKTSEYYCWASMLQRCKNPKAMGYKYWGGRDIKVCERWHKFENFYADMGDRPDDLTLDRINNNGNYEPANCRWTTRHEQQNNKCKSRPISCGPAKQKLFWAFHSILGLHRSNNQCEFAKGFGLDRENISACLRGKRKTQKGWIFQWLT
jgi:hypothetical protein